MRLSRKHRPHRRKKEPHPCREKSRTRARRTRKTERGKNYGVFLRLRFGSLPPRLCKNRASRGWRKRALRLRPAGHPPHCAGRPKQTQALREKRQHPPPGAPASTEPAHHALSSASSTAASFGAASRKGASGGGLRALT